MTHGLEVQLRHRPALDPGFLPAVLWNRAYQARVLATSRSVELGIALVRQDGTTFTHRTRILPPTAAHAALNQKYVERLVKLLLWQKGGCTILVKGCDAVARMLAAAYREKGLRAFDRVFVGRRMFGQPIDVKAASLFVIVLAALSFSACTPRADDATPVRVAEANATAAPATGTPEAAYVEFTLQTEATAGRLIYVGAGAEIDGQVNPDLVVQPGSTVRLVLVNGDGMPHDLFLPDFGVGTEYVRKIGDRLEISFSLGDAAPGDYVYYCTVPGHRQAGQEGRLVVVGP